jgi:starch phosphorylase
MADNLGPEVGPVQLHTTDFPVPTIAYFSMEIAIDPAMPTYSGGLGMLAGDTVRAAADMGVPMVAVTLLHRKGYFRQRLAQDGMQVEEDDPWDPTGVLELLGPTVTVPIQGRPVLVRAWRTLVRGVEGHSVPVVLLDTSDESNTEWDRQLTDHLYGGDILYRLCQETVLGAGGVRILDALGHSIAVYHMNEGHAALLTLGLLEDQVRGRGLLSATEEDAQAVRQRCVFTTHTPVPAGHDRFSMDMARQVLGDERVAVLERFGCCPEGTLNMTYVALHFSRYINGVAMQHGKVSQQMFPGWPVQAITNGVHAATWASPAMQALLDERVPAWRRDNMYLRHVIGVPANEIATRHQESKRALLQEVHRRTGIALREDLFTIGFARRAAAYKRAMLLFSDPERLLRIAGEHGGLQVLYGGKAHPHDEHGKRLIHDVIETAGRMRSNALQIIYLENYGWEMGALMTSGVDLWLNTPRRPYEASGTSGMKAALNGVPSLSTLDGWWVEGCIEGATGWSIMETEDEEMEAESLYEKLEAEILPLYYHCPEKWQQIMRMTLAVNGCYFNTQRMLRQYITHAYLPGTASGQTVERPEFAMV